MNDIFEYTDYKAFLRDLIDKNSGTKGIQKKLCTSCGCNPSYFSQVLNSHINLTPEHAVAIAKFLSLGDIQSHYFMHLVSLGRAGSEQLQMYHQQEMSRLKGLANNLEKKFNKSKAMDTTQAETYYSSWYFMAIHILTSIPGYDDPESIALRLSIPISTVENSLLVLEGIGLVQNNLGRWTIKVPDVHLPDKSSMHIVNLNNWRQRALLRARGSDGLHYSGLHSLSRKDAAKIRHDLSDMLSAIRQRVEPSPEEELLCLNIDWFEC